MKNLLSALLLLAPVPVFAQTTWDFGATPDRNWSASSFANWDTNASPAGTAVIFNATGSTANATTVSNIVDANYSINSFLYGTNSTNWQVTQINSPNTLTVGGNFTVGGLSGAFTTKAAFTGTGSLVINNSGTMSVSNTGSTSAVATLDMSALSTFTATLSAFNVGTGTTGFGTAYLADSSTITASTLTTGGGGAGYGSAISNKLYFGTTTTLNVDTLAFAKDRTYGTIKFRASGDGAANNTTVSGATLTIRGSAGGTTRATTMTVGDSSGTMPSSGTSTLNLTGGSVDAMVGTLTVGSSSAGLTSPNNLTATMSMAAGTFDATSVIVGQTSGTTAGTGTLTGNLNVSGGTFTAGTMTLANNTGSGNTRAAKGNLTISGTTTAVNVTGNLVMGNRNAATVTPKVDISGGTLTVGGNLAEGTGTASSIASTVNLSGGMIDMTSGSGTMTVDTLNVTGGTLNLANTATIGNVTLTAGLIAGAGTVTSANTYDLQAGSVSAILAGSGIAKSTGGTVTLSGSNTYTGATTISAGTLIARNANALGNNVSTNDVTVAANAGLNYMARTDAQLLIGGALGVTGGTGTVIGGSIGSTATSAQINVTEAATLSDAALKINIYGISGVTTLSGTNTYTLLHGGAGSSLNPTTAPTLGTVYNNTNFTVGALSSTPTDLQVGITSATALPTAFWKGGLAGATNVWAASNGSTQSNWVATSGGGDQALTPGASADVTISNSTVTTAPTATVLGADMTIKSLTIADTTNGLGLNADGYTLTITPTASTAGITVNASVPASTIGANVALGAAQTWTNNSANALTVSGVVSGGNALTKAGTGTVILSGANSYTGPTLVSGGTLEIRGSISGGMVAVNAGTFGGAGTVTTNDKSFTLGSGAKLDPGTNGSTGLSVNTGTSSIDISAGVGGSNTGALLFNLDTVSSSDKVTLTLGTLAIGNGLLDFADFNFTAGGGFGAGTYTLFSLDDTNATLSGTLAGSGLTGTIASFDATLTFSGNDIALMVIPEPNAAVSLLGGFGLLLGLQRRRWRGVKRS